MNSILLFSMALAIVGEAAPEEEPQRVVSKQPAYAEFVTSFPSAPLPFVVDEQRWRAESKRPRTPIEPQSLSEFLAQSPEQGQFYPVAKLDLGGNPHLDALVVMNEGAEDGFNDVYYLFVMDSTRGLRATLPLATFSGGGTYQTRSKAVIDQFRGVTTEQTYAVDDEPTEKYTTVSRTCYMIRTNGLPMVQACS